MSTSNNPFLLPISEENYDAFCLAYMFTYRDFDGGTLGLAWTGDLKNAGGVCERNGVSLDDDHSVLFKTFGHETSFIDSPPSYEREKARISSLDPLCIPHEMRVVVDFAVLFIG